MPPSDTHARRSALLRRIRDYLQRRDLDREGRDLLDALATETVHERRGRPERITRADAAAAVAQHGTRQAAADALGCHVNTIGKALRRPE